MNKKPSRSVASHKPVWVQQIQENALDRDPDAIGGPLTEMQQKFVRLLVDNDMTAQAAYRAAGFADYVGKGAHLAKLPKVARAIEERRAEYAIASRVTKKKVIDGFLEAIEMAKLKSDPLTMVAGWREVGRMCGFYEPVKAKLEVSVRGKVLMERLSTLTDEQLLEFAEGKGDLGEVIDVEAKNVS